MTAVFHRFPRTAGPALTGLALALFIGIGGASIATASGATNACPLVCAATPRADGCPTACPAPGCSDVFRDAGRAGRCCVDAAPAAAVDASAVASDFHDLGAAAVPLRGALPAGRVWRGVRHPGAQGSARAGFRAAHPCRAPPLHS